MLWLALIFASIVPQDSVLRDSCDLIEINHFYDESGRLVFDQLIFWDWSESNNRHQVRAWRLVKDGAPMPHQAWLTKVGHGDGVYPATYPTCSLKQWTCFWRDGESVRKVTAAAFRETWTQYDPELLERDAMPKEKRKELRSR